MTIKLVTCGNMFNRDYTCLSPVYIVLNPCCNIQNGYNIYYLSLSSSIDKLVTGQNYIL